MPGKDNPNEPESERKGEQESQHENAIQPEHELVDVSELLAAMPKSQQSESRKYRDWAASSSISSIVEKMNRSISENAMRAAESLNLRERDRILGYCKPIMDYRNDYSKMMADAANLNKRIIGDFTSLSQKAALQSLEGMGLAALDQALEFTRLNSQSELLRQASMVYGRRIYDDSSLLYETIRNIQEMNMAVAQYALQSAFGPLGDHLSQYCNVKKVSIDVDQDNKPVIHVEYNRTTVIELIKAILLYESLTPGSEIELSGELIEPNTLFSCSRKHKSHKAIYEGQASAIEKDSTKKMDVNLWEWLEDAKQQGTATEDDLDWFDFDARRAEIFFRRNLPRVLYSALQLLFRAAIQSIEDNPINYEELRNLILRCMMNDDLRDELPRLDIGRRKGTGLFRNEKDFQAALFDVFRNYNVKPTLERVDVEIRKHPLCLRKESKSSDNKETGALRRWLKKAGFKNLDEAWDRYRSSLAGSK